MSMIKVGQKEGLEAYKQCFIDVKNDERLTLAELCEIGINKYDALTWDGINELNICLIAHNSVAEFCMLKDRDELKHHMQIVRMTLISKERICFEINSININVSLFDTMLIAPVGYWGLDALSKQLSEAWLQKIDLPTTTKENMHLYKEQKRARFIVYAMRDARATLAVWITLQQKYNDIVKCTERFSSVRKVKDKDMSDKGDSDLHDQPQPWNDQNEDKPRYSHRLFKTIGGACVNDFTRFMSQKWLGIFKGSNRKLDSVKKFRYFIGDMYHGGRNESFYVGNTREDDHIKNDYLFIDLDFSSAYPSAMATVPLIDWEYEVTECKGSQILEDWCSRANSINIKECLQSDTTNISTIVGFADVSFKFPDTLNFPCLPVKHEQYGLIYPLEGRSFVSAIELILAQQIIKAENKRKKRSDEYKALLQQYKFAENKAQKKEIEVKMNAMLGTITIHKAIELKTLQNNKKPDGLHLPLFEYFQEKLKARNKAKETIKDTSSSNDDINHAKLEDKLLKEFVNTLYGKTAQAVRPKRSLDTASLTTQKLPASKVTSAYIAATTTGIVRAALSALIYALEDINKRNHSNKPILVISATTDGALFGVPKTVIQDLSKASLKEEFKDLLLRMHKAFDKFYPLKIMKISRHKLIGEDYVEIKHFATQIYSVKTRGQIGYLRDGLNTQDEDVPTILAKFGHKPPLSHELSKKEYDETMSDPDKRKQEDAKWLIGLLNKNDEKISTYKTRSLIGVKKILDPLSPYEDLVGIDVEKKINTDFDYKRILLANGSTKPHNSLRDMLKLRYSMQAIRRRGLKASPTLVTAKSQTTHNKTRLRGSLYEHTIKIFLRALFNSKLKPYATYRKNKKDIEIINAINCYLKDNYSLLKIEPLTPDHAKNAKRFEYRSNEIPNNAELVKFLKNIHLTLGIGFDEELKGSLFVKDIHEKGSYHISELDALQAFFDALHLCAHENRKIPVFSDICSLDNLTDIHNRIQSSNKTFDQKIILSAIEKSKNAKNIHRIADTSVARAVIGELRSNILPYIPKEEEKDAFLKTKKYLYSKSDFYKVILKTLPLSKPKKNPSKQKCTEQFVMALLRGIEPFNDLQDKHKNEHRLMDTLRVFGLTQDTLVKIKSMKLSYHALKNTPENKKQIRLMCEKLEKINKKDGIKIDTGKAYEVLMAV